MRRGYFICVLTAFALAGCENRPANKITGYTEGDYVYVAAPDGGWVTQMLVQRGAQVKAGDALFTLDAEAQLAQRNQGAAQVQQARKHKLREDLIDHIRAQGSPDMLPTEERDIMNYALQLTRTHRVDASLFNTLRDRHGVKWLVELTATLNFFVFVSGIANAFEVDVPADGDRMK